MARSPSRVRRSIDTRFLRRTVPIRPDSRYNPDDVASARQALVDTQLFSTVQVQTPKQLDATGQLPVTFKLVERKPRTIGAGIGYQTDQGPNTSLFWEHRNLFGAGEKLHAALDLSAVEQSLNATFSKPAFLSPQPDPARQRGAHQPGHRRLQQRDRLGRGRAAARAHQEAHRLGRRRLHLRRHRRPYGRQADLRPRVAAADAELGLFRQPSGPHPRRADEPGDAALRGHAGLGRQVPPEHRHPDRLCAAPRARRG